MTRRLLILALFLFAGAVVNVGVAWGCAYWSRDDMSQSPSPMVWQRPPPPGWPERPVVLTRFDSFGLAMFFSSRVCP